MIGTVLIYNVTLKVKKLDFLRLDNLKELSLKLISLCGLGFRRFSVEKYGYPSLAYTLVMFLNESHFIITTYPESRVIEIELASCKDIDIKEMVHEICFTEGLSLITDFCMRKKENVWQQS